MSSRRKSERPPDGPRCVTKYQVVLFEAKPNPMFSEAQRELARFLQYYENGKPVETACAHCGKKQRVLWTQLCSFKAIDFPESFGPLAPAPDAKVFPPLTGVCQTHLLAPELVEVDAPLRKRLA